MTRRMAPESSKGDGPLDQKFGKLVEESLELWHVPGVSVAVVDGDQTWAKGYGIATFPSTLVTPSTLFYAGSTTKAFTAAIMSLLVDDNENFPEVQWDTPISRLIPDDFVLQNEYATMHTTIEDALSHRSGLPGHDWAHGGANTTVRAVVRSLRHLPLTTEPRTKFQYCNAMFMTASHVIETVTQRKPGDLMREWIWEPLGMTSTFLDLQSAKASEDDLARGYLYRYDKDDGSFDEVEWMKLHLISGAGAVITNVLDYTKWAKAIMNEQTPLSKAGCEALFTPRTLMPIEDPYTGLQAYALGWRTGVYRGQRFFDHSGGMNGFGAHLLIFLDIKFAIVALANTAGTSNFVDLKLVFHLVDEKLKVPAEERFDWTSKHEATIAKGKQKSQNAKTTFYPSIPNPPLPTTLPLKSYAGSYYHPSYQTLNIYTSTSSPDMQLRADRTDQTLPQFLTFEHVSGDYFVVRAKHISNLGALFPAVYPAEFRIGADGKVKAVGIAWEEAMMGTKEEKIWLKRVQEG